jgi:D-amino peptidase
MRIMMGVDMEGITGICSQDHTDKAEGRNYAEGCRLAVGDVNAAVAGLADAGVEEVVVWDNHSSSFNHDLTELSPAASYRRGGTRNGLRWHGLRGGEEGFDGLILLGYHAKAGTLGGVLEHTMSSREWFRLKINGVECGEMAIDGALAGAVGVPVIMVSGCDKACAEAREVFGPDVVTVEVKKGYGRHGALCLPPEVTAKMLRQAAYEATGCLDKVQPLDLGSPAEIELTYKHTWLADQANLTAFEGRRVDGYTCRWTAPDFPTWWGFTEANPPRTA